MIDILVKITELLVSSVKSYSDAHDVRRKREFGQALTACYLRLLEVYFSGSAIVDHLEYFEQGFRQRSEQGWKHRHDSLISDLEKQYLNLIRLGRAIQKVAKELCILDPKIAVILGSLVKSKKNAIAELAYSMYGGNVPLGFEVTNEDLDTFLNKISLQPQEPEFKRERYFETEMFNIGLSTTIRSEFVSTEKDWELDEYKIVENYLNSNQPRKRLADLKENADQLRKLLLEHFDLDDILWSVDKFDDDTDYLF